MKFSNIADVIRPFWMPEIQNCDPVDKDLKSWISEAKGYSVINQVSNTGSFEILVTDTIELSKILAYEFSRMTVASLETIFSISSNSLLPKSHAWRIIQYYYAAFFSGHAFIRSLGFSCSHIETQRFLKLNQLIKISFSSSPTITGGDFQIKFDKSSKILSFEPLTLSSHKALWHVYLNIMKDLKIKIPKLNDVPKDILEKSDVVLTNISNCITRSGNNSGNWLSMIRNDVNYRQEFDVWFPSSRQPQYYESILRNCEKWIEDPLILTIWPDETRPIQSFIEACSVIISLNRVSFLDMNSRSSNRNSLVNKKIMHFSRKTKLKLWR